MSNDNNTSSSSTSYIDKKDTDTDDDKEDKPKETKETDELSKKDIITGDVVSDESSDDDEEEEEDSVLLMQKMTQLFANKLRFQSEDKDNKPKVEKILSEPTIDAIVDYIKSGKCKNIVVMVGAGISTAAGIPDFRSPGSGLYHNLAKYKLPSPNCMFDIDFFRKNPNPFFDLAKQLFPGKFCPTISHMFLKLLNDKGLLLRLYTQNIDTLERIAGIPGDKLVEAHGTFHTSHCIDCHKEYSFQWMKDKIFSDSLVPKCDKCGATVKPDIVFFGEQLPERFFRLADRDFKICDLLIIIGTSLTVQPFAGLVDTVRPQIPRLLINKTKCGQSSQISSLLDIGSGLEFDSKDNYRDVLLLEESDKGCKQMAESLDWTQDLNQFASNKDKTREWL
ncbi:NAD-dependent protein deacetylase sirtuin-2-like [Oppia nitens]|uniref:NAD-dependent protein deacetylase sirtuin-2-like n=1 Tax=Oppia nitens TaxID=1686743 RepID=UPI0023DB058F|nr:NAD-dependent protein deacetylase sirtuin-2-like [Oppia nitens]